jgi:hypothetical protein
MCDAMGCALQRSLDSVAYVTTIAASWSDGSSLAVVPTEGEALEAIARHPFTPHPMRMFHDAVFDIRPPDENSYFNLGDGS